MNPWTLTAAACGKGLLQQLWNEQDAPSWQFPAALTELNDQARCKHSVNNNYLSFYQHCNPLQINIVSENPNIYSSEVAFPPPLLFFSLKEGRLATSTQSSESSENFSVCATKPCSVCNSRHHIPTNNPSPSASFACGAPEALCPCFTFQKSLLHSLYDTKKSQISTSMRLATTIDHILLCKKKKNNPPQCWVSDAGHGLQVLPSMLRIKL